MGRIRIKLRSGELRCAFCHGGLEGAAAAACSGCGTRLHRECSELLARCPTLGCLLARPPARRSAPRRSGWSWAAACAELLLWLALIPLVPALLVGLVLYCLAKGLPYPAPP